MICRGIWCCPVPRIRYPSQHACRCNKAYPLSVCRRRGDVVVGPIPVTSASLARLRHPRATVAHRVVVSRRRRNCQAAAYMKTYSAAAARMHMHASHLQSISLRGASHAQHDLPCLGYLVASPEDTIPLASPSCLQLSLKVSSPPIRTLGQPS